MFGAMSVAVKQKPSAPAPHAYLRLVEPVIETPIHWWSRWGTALAKHAHVVIPLARVACAASIQLFSAGDSSPTEGPTRRLRRSESGLERELEQLKQREDALRRHMTGVTWFWDPSAHLRHGRDLIEVQQQIRQVQLEQEIVQLELKRIGCDPDSDQWRDIQQRIHHIENEIAAIPKQTVGAEKLWTTLMANTKGSSQPTEKTDSSKKNDASDKANFGDWEALASRGDTAIFVEVLDQRIKSMNAEVVTQIESGKAGSEIIQWFNDVIVGELRATDTAAQKLPKTALDQKLLHDARNRRVVLQSRIPMLLQMGRLDEAKAACQPAASDLKALIVGLKTKFEDKAIFELKGLEGIHLAPHLNPDHLAHILENVVQNAVEHPKPDQKPTLIFTYESGILFVTDDGKGMSAETLENLRAGKRVHDDQVVDVEDTRSFGHGFGVGQIFDYAKQLNMDVEYDSDLGVGTTVALTPAPDGFVPDPIHFVLTGSGDFGQLGKMVEVMSDLQRVVLMTQLWIIADAIGDEFLPQMQTAVANHTSWKPLQKRAQQILERYTRYMDIVLKGHPELKRLNIVKKCDEIRNILVHIMEASLR